MSECVVRMELPKCCKKCKTPLCLWLNDDGDFIVDHTIAAVQDFRKKNDDGFPYFCPIICSLPEGHGRLGDLDALADDVRNLWDYKTVDGITATTVLNQTLTDIRNCPTIVPAERSETCLG